MSEKRNPINFYGTILFTTGIFCMIHITIALETNTITAPTVRQASPVVSIRKIFESRPIIYIWIR